MLTNLNSNLILAVFIWVSLTKTPLDFMKNQALANWLVRLWAVFSAMAFGFLDAHFGSGLAWGGPAMYGVLRDAAEAGVGAILVYHMGTADFKSFFDSGSPTVIRPKADQVVEAKPEQIVQVNPGQVAQVNKRSTLRDMLLQREQAKAATPPPPDTGLRDFLQQREPVPVEPVTKITTRPQPVMEQPKTEPEAPPPTPSTVAEPTSEPEPEPVAAPSGPKLPGIV